MIRNFLVTLNLLIAVPALAVVTTGKPAPDFTAKGADGKTYKLSQFKGKAVVLEWFNNECPFVRKHYDSKNMQNLQKEVTKSGTVWLTIASSATGKQGHLEPDSAKKVIQERGIASTALLLDDKSAIGKLYGAKVTPHMFVIDKQGILAYQGAIDDRPESTPDSLQGAKNYVTAAIQSIDKGQPVAEANTDAYGCSVKY